MADRLVVGDTVTLTNTFKVSGTATDPTTISLVVTDPAGTATTYTYAGATITRSSTGVYTKNITASTAGIWSYTWTGTGAAADVENGVFEVSPTQPTAGDPLDVLTLYEAKEELGIGLSDTSKDGVLARKITAVSQRLDQACGPIVQRTVTGEVLEGGGHEAWVKFGPVFSWTTVAEYSGTVAQVLDPEDYDTQPAYGYVAQRGGTPTSVYSGRLSRRSAGGSLVFPVGPEAVRVTYVAGRYVDTAGVDALFKEAAAVMLQNAWRPQEAAVQSLGEFDVPAQNFPRFGIPNYVRDMLAEEWLAGPVVA